MPFFASAIKPPTTTLQEIAFFFLGRWLAMLPAIIVQGYHIYRNTLWDSFSAPANNCWKVNELIYIWLLFNCHSSGSKHAGPLLFCCPSLLPYRLLMTTAFPPWSAACKVLSFMILVMTNWKPSSWLCLVYKWRFSVLGLITQMILTLSSSVYHDE